MIGDVVRAGLIGGSGVSTGALVATLVGHPVLESVPRPAIVAAVQAVAEAPCEIDYRIVLGVLYVETRFGTIFGAEIGADGRALLPDGTPILSSAEARGPAQFMDETWADYALRHDLDADEDGQEDPDDIEDATRAMVTKLCADGVTDDWEEATGAYNGGGNWRQYSESREYVRQIESFVNSLPPLDIDPDASIHEPTGDRSPGRFFARAWDRLVIRPWLWVGVNAQGPALGAWRGLDSLFFGAAPATPTPPNQGVQVAPDMVVAAEVAPALRRMLAAAAADGVTLTAESSWRSSEKQMELRKEYCPDPINSDPGDCAIPVAKVGTSEHEYGYAVDFHEAGWAWLAANARRFGFAPTAGIEKEPWHWGYVG